MKDIRRFIDQYKARCQDGWHDRDGFALKGFADLYRAAGDPADRRFVLDALEKRVNADGTIPGSGTDDDLLGLVKTLFFALDETGDPRFRRAADFLHERFSAHLSGEPRTFPQDDASEPPRPDCLYMIQPFRAEYDRRFLSGLEAGDIASQFRDARPRPCGPDACLYLMALVDCVGQMSEQLYEHRRLLMDRFLEAARGILPCADPESGLFSPATDRAGALGNCPDTSGSAMIAYALMKGVRLDLLDPERYLALGLKAFRTLAERFLTADNGGRAVGPFIMAWSEYLRCTPV